MKFYEDVPLNEPHHSTETYTVSAEEIMSFAGKWDPMPFHLDEQAAKQTPIGKLFASSIHTIAIGVRISHTMMKEEMAVIAGLGWQDVRFPVPVCAGDTLRMCAEVIEKRESRSHPDRGIVTSQNKVINQNDEVVAEYKIVSLMMKHPPV